MENSTRSWSGKTLAGIVRYWSIVVAITYELGNGWPGYRYTPEERAQLEKLNKDMSAKHLWAFFGLNTLLNLLLAGLLVVVGMLPGLHMIAPNLQDLRFGPFAVLLGSLCVIMISVGLPAAMGITAMLLERVWPWTIPAEPSAAEINHLARKMLRQFFVMGMIGTGLSMGFAAIYHFSGDAATSGAGALLFAVLRMAAPAVTLGTTVFLLARRG